MDKPAKITSGVSIAALKKGPTFPANRSLAVKLSKLGYSQTPDLQCAMMFDITGSMFKYFDAVKQKIAEISETVMRRAPRSEFSIFAYRNHGNENLGNIYYASRLTGNIGELSNFLEQIEQGGGGRDGLTCMEECFSEANRRSWAVSSAKSIVIIGDMPPHGVRDSIKKCPNNIDYRIEVEKFKQKGIKLYPVFCGHHKDVRKFYQWLATETGGRFLELDEIDLLSDLLVAICMKSLGRLDEHKHDLSNTKRLPDKTEKLLKMLE